MENTPRTRVAGTHVTSIDPVCDPSTSQHPCQLVPRPTAFPARTRGKRCCVHPGRGSGEAGTPSSPPADVAAFSPGAPPANNPRWPRPAGRPGEGLGSLLRCAPQLLLSRSRPLASCWSAASRPPVPPLHLSPAAPCDPAPQRGFLCFSSYI